MKQKLLLFTFFQLSLAGITGCNSPGDKATTAAVDTEIKDDETVRKEHLSIFAKKYAEAWCSQKPSGVAAFFAPGGSLKVNTDPPAVGRDAIIKVAQGFMAAFPDMMVTMDSLISKPGGTEFHWTLTGTNSGAGGTGNKVRVSGFEVWQFGDDGLILESIGSFDSEEYNRQLKEGIK